MNKRHIAVLGMLAMLWLACSKSMGITGFAGFQQPGNFPQPAYHFNDNKITQAGFELGRRLFYEPRLSRNNTISCGTCHIQTSAFTHHGHDVSHGIDDRLGSRNAPPIMNLAWYNSFMWDGGVFNLDLQPIAPITNHVEMDESVEHVLSKLKTHPDYPGLFKKAFGSEEITTARTMKALSQFMLLCISSQSKYDKVMRKEGETFTADEQQGYAVFQQKCSSCHKEPLFTDGSFRNNGIGAGPNDDQGRYAVTLQAADKYRFKVPSLRNLAYTAPYMHDGRFYSLNAVLDHYSGEVQASPTLDPLLQQNGRLGITLSNTEKMQLLAFLKTLNDTGFVTNRQLAEQ